MVSILQRFRFCVLVRYYVFVFSYFQYLLSLLLENHYLLATDCQLLLTSLFFFSFPKVKQVRKLRKEDGSLWTVNTLAKYFSTLPSVIRCVFCY